MKIYFINLEGATERRAAMDKAFGAEDLVRVDAIDGMVWASDALGRQPTWKSDVRAKFVEQGILAPQSQLPPTHLACNLSHRMAWDLFLRTKDEWCVVMEDDVEPTEVLDGARIEDILVVPPECGMLYLMDERTLAGRLRLDSKGVVKRALTLAAYALNRRTAEIFMKAIQPMVYLADFQLPICTYEGMQVWVPRHKLQNFESKKKVNACGLQIGGLIRHSIHAKKSQLGNPAP